MFGKNAITKSFKNNDGRLLVNEIWPTIQGEGPQSGWPALFVRLAKCNLKCFFCDTEFEKGTWATLAHLETLVNTLRRKSQIVVITGGEPLLQDIIPFVEMCNDKFDLPVSIETAGTVCPPNLERRFNAASLNRIVCSPKTPQINPAIIQFVDAWKYIVRSGELDPDDGLPIKSTQIKGKDQRLFRPTVIEPSTIYLQPCEEYGQGSEYCNVANRAYVRDMCLKFGYRYSLQVHKFIGAR